MNISHFLLGVSLLCILPHAANARQNLDATSHPLVSPEEAMRQLWAEPIKLHLTNVSLHNALLELARQSHISVSLPFFGVTNEFDQRVSVDIETHFFQTALDAITKSVGVERLRYEPIWQQRREWYMSSPPSPFNGPISRSGTFEVKLREFENVASTYFWNQSGDPTRQNKSRLSFSFSSDPRFIYIGQPQIRVTKAFHNLKQSPKERVWVEVPNKWEPDEEADEFTTNVFVDSPEEAKEISRLEGTLLYTVPVSQEHWVIGNTAEGDTKTRTLQCGGQQVRVGVQYYARGGNEIKLILKVEAVPNGEPAQTRLPITAKQVLYRMNVSDSQGRPVLPYGYNAQVESKEHSFIIARFLAPSEGPTSPFQAKPPHSISISFDVPTKFVQTEVPFSFSNLPLP